MIEKILKYGFAVGLGSFMALQADAAILSVCQSGCQYSLPSQAYAAAASGDTIQIQPGTYTDCIYIQKSNLTIAGVNGTPKMVNRVCGQKGILVTAAPNITVRNLELSGATNNDNYAGIRHDAAGSNLTLDSVYIHDNDNGILSSSSGDTLTITNSRFENNGMNSSSGMAHNLYIGHSASVIFTNSRSTSAKLKGHEFKTRAARTEIRNSTLATLGGSDSRLIDVSNGGTLIVQDSVLQKSATSDNNEMIAFGPEGLAGGRTHSVTLSRNTVIGDRSPTDLIAFFNGASTISITGNTLVAIRNVSNSGTPSGNTVFTSRTAAGYQAYPWLPAAGASPAPTPTPAPAPAPTPAPTPTPAPAPEWVKCANENGSCAFTGTRNVRYGANGSYVTKSAVAGPVPCTNSYFGRDPAYGVAKVCEYSAQTVSAPTTPAWNRCANENQTCSFSGTRQVRYGANGVFVTKIATGSVSCSNQAFGKDPVPGVAKYCDYSTETTTITWTDCASEGGTCSVSGTREVRYGANNSFLKKMVTGSIACNNSAFGGDPAYGVTKKCQFSSVSL